MDRRARSADNAVGSGHGRRLSPSGLGQRGRRRTHRVYTITDMAHGTPLATGKADTECGAAGPFLLEVGISSSYHIARFFGLTTAGLRPAASPERQIVTAAPKQLHANGSVVHPRRSMYWMAKCWPTVRRLARRHAYSAAHAHRYQLR